MTKSEDTRFENLVQDTSEDESYIFSRILNSQPRMVCNGNVESYIIYTIGKTTIYHSLEPLRDETTNQIIERVGLLNLESGQMNHLTLLMSYKYEMWEGKALTLVRPDALQKVYSEMNGLLSQEGCVYLLEEEDYLIKETIGDALIEVMECLTKAPNEQIKEQIDRMKRDSFKLEVLKEIPL